MVLKFTIPLSRIWYAIGTAIINSDDARLPFDQDQPILCFYYRKKEMMKDVFIRISKSVEKEDATLDMFDKKLHNGKIIVSGRIDKRLSIPILPINYHHEISAFTVRMIEEIINQYIETQKGKAEEVVIKVKKDNLPKSLLENVGRFDSLMDMAHAGFSIEEQISSLRNEDIN